MSTSSLLITEGDAGHLPTALCDTVAETSERSHNAKFAELGVLREGKVTLSVIHGDKCYSHTRVRTGESA